MMKVVWIATLVALCCVALPAQEDKDFRRERRPENARAKDGLEGKKAPKLQVGKWLNSDKKITLDSLKGRVVLLDFWGTW